MTGTGLHIIREPVLNDETSRFAVMSAQEWRTPAPAMRWLVQGVWPDASHGPIAGAKKSLKTYSSMDLALSVASGLPFLGRFAVPQPRPVLYLLGEGGRVPGRRRFERIADSKCVDAAELAGDGMLLYAYDVAPLDSPEFLDFIRRTLDETQPGLVVMDSLYAFHPAIDNVGNLYERGPMLAALGHEFEGCSLALNDHFNKNTPGGLDLDYIAQSGMGAWANSWMLQAHREDPRVDEGEFRLTVQFGGREWGGAQYDVDWTVGRFNPETGTHDGELAVEVRDAAWSTRKSGAVDYSARVEDCLRENPFALTRSEVLKTASGKEEALRVALDALMEVGRVVERADSKVGEDGKTRSRTVLGLDKIRRSGSTSRPDDGSEGREVDA